MTTSVTTDASCVVAIIPAKDCNDTVADTVTALLRDASISRVVVVDDGSLDETAEVAANAGATVIRSAFNRGKGGALQLAVDASPDAAVFLLVDADTGTSAQNAIALLPPVLNGLADMAIGVLPTAGGRGGFGVVKRLSAWGIRAASGFRARAPLSGQRAVRGELLRSLDLAPRFGLEVAMTVDAVRRGHSVVEVDVQMEHRHRGRRLDGFLHRARQGVDITQALYLRVIAFKARMAILGLAIALALTVEAGAAAAHQRTGGVSLPHVSSVKIELVPGLRWQDYKTLPNAGAASVATGDVKSASLVAASGSRDSKAQPSPDVHVVTLTSGQIPLLEPTPQGRAMGKHPPGEGATGDEVRIIAGITPPGGEALLRPVFLVAPGVRGTLVSPSTHQTGIVDLTDLAPTALSLQGKAVPPSMTGTVLRVSDEQTSSIATFERTAKMVRFYDRIRPTFIWIYVLSQVLVFLLALWLARRGREVPRAALVARLIASIPITTYLLRWLHGARDMGILEWSALMVVGVGMIGIMSGAGLEVRRRPTVALQRILIATIGLLLVDVITGSHLQVSGIFGSSPALGNRYSGLGNPAAEVLLLATVLWCALHVSRAASKRDAVARAAALFVVVTVADGLPSLGSDVGGMFAFAVTGAITVSGLYVEGAPKGDARPDELGALRPKGAELTRAELNYLRAFFGRVRLKWMASIVVLSAVLIAIAGYADYQRAPDERTHLGRLVARISNEGLSPLIDVITRKIDTNVIGYGFPWNIGLIALAAGILIELVRSDRWSATLPLESPARFGMVMALVGSFIAYAVNDSGIVVLALSAVFIGPYVLLEHRVARMTRPKLEVSAP